MKYSKELVKKEKRRYKISLSNSENHLNERKKFITAISNNVINKRLRSNFKLIISSLLLLFALNVIAQENQHFEILSIKIDDCEEDTVWHTTSGNVIISDNVIRIRYHKGYEAAAITEKETYEEYETKSGAMVYSWQGLYITEDKESAVIVSLFTIGRNKIILSFFFLNEEAIHLELYKSEVKERSKFFN